MPIDIKAMRQRVQDVIEGDHLEVYEIEELLDEIEGLRVVVDIVQKEIKAHDDLPHADEQDAADAFYSIKEFMKAHNA